jgi:Nif-specific regulatory protein
LEIPIIVGKSTSVLLLRSFINKAARSDSNVLILGETGVGKGLAAKSIHFLSERRNKPFIRLNCGNLNENLIESELFGHRKGAFTGALNDRPGLIEAANGGTFFFDEVGDCSPSLQAKLLSLIEDREIRRIGENHGRKIDARFIFATNKDLNFMVTRGKFRLDLFYRINILAFCINPLRERKEDIPIITELLLKNANNKYGMEKKLSPQALDEIMRNDHKGNIRELENIIERAWLFSEDIEIGIEDISISNANELYGAIKQKLSIDIIRLELMNCNGNITKTARKLGISRQWLHRLINMELR